MATKIQLRGDTLTNWNVKNPVLADREVALVATDPNKPQVYDSKKVGDGVHKFSELEMLGFECLQELGDSTQFPVSQQVVTDELRKINANTGVDEYPTFSESTAYSAGDVVNYNGKLYKFTAAHAAGAWIGTDVEETSLKENITNLITEKLAELMDSQRNK